MENEKGNNQSKTSGIFPNCLTGICLSTRVLPPLEYHKNIF